MSESKIICMPSKLTAENGAKALLSGEFSETVVITCTACYFELYGDVDCEVCAGSGEYLQDVPISWTTIKAIYAKAANHMGQPIVGEFPDDHY